LRKLRLATDAEAHETQAVAVTEAGVDDAGQVDHLLKPIDRETAGAAAGGVYDERKVYRGHATFIPHERSAGGLTLDSGVFNPALPGTLRVMRNGPRPGSVIASARPSPLWPGRPPGSTSRSRPDMALQFRRNDCPYCRNFTPA
jgi:hypothetical protein